MISAVAFGLGLITASPARADLLAYASIDPFAIPTDPNSPSPDQGEFGTIDLSTGAFTQVAQPPGSIGPSNPGPAGYIGGLVTGPGNTLYASYAWTPTVLWTVNPASGAVSTVGIMPTKINPETNQGYPVESFGSTTSALYLTDRDDNLYSVNAATGNTTFIANIGEPGSLLSTNSSVLYGAIGSTLYTIDPANGHTTLIGTPVIDGSTGYDWTVLTMIDGVLYGGACCSTNSQDGGYMFDGLYTIDLSNVSATYVGGTDVIWGIAPETFSSSGSAPNVPEPASWALLLTGMIGVGALRRARRA